MSNELKPCPCCGSENIEVKYIGNDLSKKRKVEIKCKSCRLTRTDGAIYHNHDWCFETAKKYWNTRTESTELEQIRKERDEIRKAAESMMMVVNESNGVFGYHLNGDVSEWDELEEVANLQDTLAKLNKQSGE